MLPEPLSRRATFIFNPPCRCSSMKLDHWNWLTLSVYCMVTRQANKGSTGFIFIRHTSETLLALLPRTCRSLPRLAFEFRFLGLSFSTLRRFEGSAVRQDAVPLSSTCMIATQSNVPCVASSSSSCSLCVPGLPLPCISVTNPAQASLSVRIPPSRT